MRDESTAHRLLQDFSTLVGALLPLAQLFAANQPTILKDLLLADTKFAGVTLITLVLSYVLIIAYLARPWFILTLPFQAKKSEKYDNYLRQLNEASAANNFVHGEQPTDRKIQDFINNLAVNPVKPPLQIKFNNVVSTSVTIIFLSSLAFVVTGLVGIPDVTLVILQSVSYILLLSFTALALTVYYRNSQDNRRNEQEQKVKTQQAISLATDANAFGLIPQVKFISCFDDDAIPSNHHVWVEYQGQKYEIITDYRAQRLVAVYPFK